MDAIYRSTPPGSLASGGQIAETCFRSPATQRAAISCIDMPADALQVNMEDADENPYDQINNRETLSIRDFNVNGFGNEHVVAIQEYENDVYGNDLAADALSVISVYT